MHGLHCISNNFAIKLFSSNDSAEKMLIFSMIHSSDELIRLSENSLSSFKLIPQHQGGSHN